ncbi:MAG TPA: secretin N-terminal domain-containing protein [Candidatus Babeliales bacterium]|jgi:general secretion pathway protein D|nr:secretin N-terminal domain-containing protein [Candidatus Babeliales bacterium]
MIIKNLPINFFSKKFPISGSLLLVFALSLCTTVYCDETDFINSVTEVPTENLIDNVTQVPTENLPELPDFSFNYENEDIINIINKLAALKKLNVIFPPGDILNIKITRHMDKKITVSQAWDILITYLDIAGFFIVPEGSTIRIVRNSKEISREPLPTYIGVHPDDLPNTDQPIRYLYYLTNIKISDQPENEINGILKDILPENALFKGDSTTNSLLLVGKANDIRAVMKIVIELDQVNFQEKIDIISLRHTSATIVAQLINEQLIKPENGNPYRLDVKKTKEIPYFSGFTKIIPEPRLNKLIILGRPQAVERLKDFIKNHIDVAPDSGKSILHVYHLQYLDATTLAPVIERIVQGEKAGGPSQASSGETKAGGIERFFDKVIISTDYPVDKGADSANSEKQERFTFYGGNNLIVAARNDDWKQIKKLIEELDTPQRQVLIEVLIVDLTVDDARTLAAMTRVPDKVPIPDDMAFQSAILGQPIPSELPATPETTIDSNLLKNAYDNNGILANPSSGATKNLTDFAEAGTTMLSLNDNDGRTWSVWEILQNFTTSKILSHPHVMARNNKEAMVSIGQTRWLVDKVKDISSVNYGGATTIQYKPISANLTVKLTPRISSASSVNLQVLVTINEYVAPATSDVNAGNNTMNIRKVETNAYVKSGGVFALGGLIRTLNATNIREVPLLGKIPILGWFFKGKSTETIKNNLTVFISPTIIEPRLHAGANDYTQDYVNIAKEQSRGNLFDSLKDPITRWFFTGELNSERAIDKFVAKDETLPQNDISYRKATPKKMKKLELEDSTDILTHTPKGTVADNAQKSITDLKSIVQNDPNPFLKA